MREIDRLRALIARVKERVPIYGDRLADVEPGDIASLDDLRRLPFTRKDDLRDTYPFGMFAVPPEEIVRIHASSGTTGKLTVVGYTAADVDLLARVNARSLAMAGAGPGMMLHNAYGYGLFTGGLGLHYGGERLGMAVVPVSVGMTERQLMLITDFRPDMIACTPSYALTLVQSFQERAVAPAEISLSYALLGGEPWTEAMRREIDAGLGVVLGEGCNTTRASRTSPSMSSAAARSRISPSSTSGSSLTPSKQASCSLGTGMEWWVFGPPSIKGTRGPAPRSSWARATLFMREHLDSSPRSVPSTEAVHSWRREVNVAGPTEGGVTVSDESHAPAASDSPALELTDDHIQRLLRNADRLSFGIRPAHFVLINRARLLAAKAISETDALLIDRWVADAGGGVQPLRRAQPETRPVRKHTERQKRPETMVLGIPAQALTGGARASA